MFHVLHRFWRWLLARLGYCGGAHFLAGAPSLPPPLTPEQEKVLLSRMGCRRCRCPGRPDHPQPAAGGVPCQKV